MMYVVQLPLRLELKAICFPSGDHVGSPSSASGRFVSERDGNLEIYSMDIASKAITRLTYSESIDKHAQWSPDGQEIVFISDRDGGDMDVYIMKADGTSTTCLVDWDGDETHPTWSPDHSSPPAYSVGQGAPDLAIKNHFIDAYNRNGGVSVLGDPATEVHDAWGYLVQDFPGASGYDGGIIMYNPYKKYAYYIHGAIWERYYGLGGPKAETDIEFELGPPISDIKPYIHTQPPEVSNHGTQFRYQNFEGGALNYNVDTGEVFEIHGAIFAKWCELGYASGVLGLVTSDELEAVQSFKGTIGRVSDFENGHLHWHGSGEHYIVTYVTHGDLDNFYTSMGGTASWLGFPVKDQEDIGGHGYCEFEGGYIGWNAIDGVYEAFEKTSIKSKLFIEDALPDVVVNKAHGDKTDVIIEIENTGDTTQNVKVELDCSVLFENGVTPEIYSRNDYFGPEEIQDPLDVEIEPHSKKQIIWRFEIPLFPLNKIVFAGKTFVSDKLVSVDGGLINVVQDSTGIIVTNRKLLYEKFGKNAETTSLLHTIYTIADGNDPEKEICNVVYYVDRYSGLAADWDQIITYPSWGIPSTSINEVALDIDLIVESKREILQSDYLTIIGGDEIIPFYRLPNPGWLPEWIHDYDSNDSVLEIINNNHIPTDNIYSDLNGNGLDDWVKPELSIGRISSATAKDMEKFMKNSLKGPSINKNAIVATDKSMYNIDAIVEILKKKGLIFEPKLSKDSGLAAHEIYKEMHKDKGYKILAYAGHSNYGGIGGANFNLTPSDFNDPSILKNHPLFTIGGCRAGIVTDENSTEWKPYWTDNLVWSLSHNGASAILGSGSLSKSKGFNPLSQYVYAEMIYNDFYKYLFRDNSKNTNPVGEALKEAERNYDSGDFWDSGEDKKARVQFILYSIPWMIFDPPINPPEPVNKSYNVTFTDPEKIDTGVYRQLVTIEVIDYNLMSVEGFDLITIEGASYILSDFKPILPKINTGLYLPIQSESENKIDLGYLNVPSFQSIMTNDPPNSSFTNVSDITGVCPSPRFVSTNITYTGYNKIRINVAPVQYNIDTNETVLFNKTVLEIIYKTTDDLVITDFLSINNKFNINDIISTNVTVENVGSETVENVHYDFTIKDLFGTIVKNHSSSEFNIPMGIQQFEANVSTHGLQQGSYLAEINILNNTGYILANSSEYIYLISGEITNFTINTTGIEQGGDLKLNFEFENYNDTDVTIDGQISISNSQNNIVDTLLIPLTIASGDSAKQFSYIWNSGNNNPGWYKAELTLSSEGLDYGSEDQWFTILNFYNLSFLPPLSSQGFCNIESGSTLPIRFTARDNDTGDFISDSSVNVSIINIAGCILASFNSTNGVQIDSDDEQYKVDFNTMNYPELKLSETYTVRVTFGIEGNKKSYLSAYFSLVDRTAPSSITNLHSTAGTTWLNFTWTNPSDPDFNHTELYLNGTYFTNIPAPQNYYNITGLLPYTSYELSTRTVDTFGNINLTWVNDTASTLPASGTTLNLYTGWNLISLPLMPDDTSIISILSPVSGNYSIVWAYNASDTDNHWKKYDPATPFGNDLTNMEPGKGYWIMMTSDDTLNISGTMPAPTDIELWSGWNLIGYNSLDPQTITDALFSISGNYSIIWAYNASDSTDHWKKYDPNTPFGNDLANMEPGKGYWIMMTSDDIYVVVCED